MLYMEKRSQYLQRLFKIAFMKNVSKKYTCMHTQKFVNMIFLLLSLDNIFMVSGNKNSWHKTKHNLILLLLNAICKQISLFPPMWLPNAGSVCAFTGQHDGWERWKSRIMHLALFFCTTHKALLDANMCYESQEEHWRWEIVPSPYMAKVKRRRREMKE